jgi:phage replication initiation protein
MSESSCAIASPALPPLVSISSNTPSLCANAPHLSSSHLVIRDETSTPIESPVPLAHIDWLAFTLSLPILMQDDEPEMLRWLIGQLFREFGLPKVTIEPTKSGWNGYNYRLNIGENAQYGLIAFGGKNQRGTFHVELNATACAHVVDWNTVRQWGESNSVKITRIDLAHDDMEAKVVSIAKGRAWYEAGEFNSSGRPPAAKLIDDMGSGIGKTLYIGNRENGKMLRIYEKGRELGDPFSPWVRVELELRGKNRVVPWDVLTTPTTYLAGGYPCLAYLSAEQDKIRTIKKSVQITLESMQRYLHTAGGKSINALMQTNGEDAVALVNAIRREGIPRRLVNYADFLPRVLDGSEIPA